MALWYIAWRPVPGVAFAGRTLQRVYLPSEIGSNSSDPLQGTIHLDHRSRFWRQRRQGSQRSREVGRLVRLKEPVRCRTFYHRRHLHCYPTRMTSSRDPSQSRSRKFGTVELQNWIVVAASYLPSKYVASQKLADSLTVHLKNNNEETKIREYITWKKKLKNICHMRFDVVIKAHPEGSTLLKFEIGRRKNKLSLKISTNNREIRRRQEKKRSTQTKTWRWHLRRGAKHCWQHSPSTLLGLIHPSSGQTTRLHSETPSLHIQREQGSGLHSSPSE